jgi:hypothetical protein
MPSWDRFFPDKLRLAGGFAAALSRGQRAAFLLPLACPWLAEVGARSLPRMTRFHAADWLLFVALSAASLAFWGALLSLLLGGRRSRWGVLAVAVLLGVIAGGHRRFYMQYASVLTPGFVEAGLAHGFDLRRTLGEQRAAFALAMGLPALALGALLWLAEVPGWLGSVRRRWRGAVVGAGLLALPWLPESTAKPVDVQVGYSAARYLIGRLSPARPAAAVVGPYVPPLRGSTFNVLLVFGESLRHDSYCNDPGGPCAVTPAVHRVLPERIPLDNLRSVGSWTIVSTAVATTGLGMQTPRPEYDHHPTVFELARASGRHTEYLGSQKLEYLFLRTATIDHVVQFHDISDNDGYEYADDELSQIVEQRMRALPGPSFVMMQPGDTHSPYAIDKDDAPFQPGERDFSWEGNHKLFNQYRNSIHRQDKLLGRMFERLRAAGVLDRTVILFTSDHGEAFRDHTTLYHGGSVHDEEIHVPGWIWVPPAVQVELGPRWQMLLQNRALPYTHLDVTPTLLDLFGILGDPAIAAHVAPLPGQSMLRPWRLLAPAALGNCTEFEACAFRNYGMIQGPTKLEAREWDGYWNCWALAPTDAPSVLLPMADPRCQAMLPAARLAYPVLPNNSPY